MNKIYSFIFLILTCSFNESIAQNKNIQILLRGIDSFESSGYYKKLRNDGVNGYILKENFIVFDNKLMLFLSDFFFVDSIYKFDILVKKYKKQLGLGRHYAASSNDTLNQAYHTSRKGNIRATVHFSAVRGAIFRTEIVVSFNYRDFPKMYPERFIPYDYFKYLKHENIRLPLIRCDWTMPSLSFIRENGDTPPWSPVQPTQPFYK